MKNRRKKVFERVVNPVLLKYLTKSHSSEVSIAKGIPMKYLKVILKTGDYHMII